MANAALKGQPSGRFLGVNLRQDRVSLADEELAKAINADLHSQPGTIVLRLGRTAQNSSALTDLVIRRIAKINTHRYRVAGQSAYCGETRILNGLLSANLITTMLPFRPFADTTIWNFIADDSVMRKANCTTVGTWGLSAPSQPTTAIGIQGSLTGDYVVQYTFVRLAGAAVAAEGNPSDITAAVTLSANDLGIGDMAHPTDTTTNALGIYRSVAGTTPTLLDSRVSIPTDNAYAVTHNWEVTAVDTTSALQLHWTSNPGSISVSGISVGARRSTTWEPTGTGDSEDAAGRRATYRWEISDAYVTTQTLLWAYSSTEADTALGDLIEVDNGLPPTASWVTNFQEHAFFCRDATNPHYLWFSKRFKPEQVPATNFLELGNADDPLQCAATVAGQLGVFSRKTKYRVFGNDTSGFSSLEAMSPRGTPCPMAMIPTEFGILFVARDGIFSTVLSSPDTGFADRILPLFFGETVNDMLPLNWDQASTFSAATYKGRYYFAYAETGSSTPNRLAVYSRDTQHWYHYDHPLRSLYVEEDTDLCLGGGLDGFVYILENGTTDNGSSIALDVDTKDFQGESKDARKLFLYLKVDCNTLGASVTVKFYVDDVLERTTTVNTSTRAERLLPLPEGTMGHHWRANFTYTGSTRIRIYPCAALYLPLGAA
jgi:hypothetical protein